MREKEVSEVSEVRLKPLIPVIEIARICHEANRAYCRCIGDSSQPMWEDAPDWQVQSALNGVCFHIENPGANDAASHENWLREKIADGWQYGEIKNANYKTHPCIVPFEQLPIEQQIKDKIFRSIVHSLCDA